MSLVEQGCCQQVSLQRRPFRQPVDHDQINDVMLLLRASIEVRMFMKVMRHWRCWLQSTSTPWRSRITHDHHHSMHRLLLSYSLNFTVLCRQQILRHTPYAADRPLTRQIAMHFTTNTAVNSVGETLCVCDNNASITIVHKLNVYLMFTCSLSKCCLQLCIVGVECSIRPYLCVSDDITIRIYLVTPGPYIYR